MLNFLSHFQLTQVIDGSINWLVSMWMRTTTLIFSHKSLSEYLKIKTEQPRALSSDSSDFDNNGTVFQIMRFSTKIRQNVRLTYILKPTCDFFLTKTDLKFTHLFFFCIFLFFVLTDLFKFFITFWTFFCNLTLPVLIPDKKKSA